MEGIVTAKMTDFFRELESEHVTVKVGKDTDRKDFTVPKEILCRRSEWFRNALKEDRFREGETKIITLPEDQPDGFQVFLYFIYNGNLCFPRLGSDMANETRGEELVLHTRLWAFGDKYLHPRFQSFVIFRLCEILQDIFYPESIPSDALATAFQTCEASSPIRTLIADYVTLCMGTTKGEYQIHSELAVCPGFFKVFYESTFASALLPRGDFPRFYKPLKYTALLGMDDERVFDDGQGVDGYMRGQGVPSGLKHTCEECGFHAESITPMCKECNISQCGCESPKWAFYASSVWRFLKSKYSQGSERACKSGGRPGSTKNGALN